MTSLANARTRLGPFGHATRPNGSFLRGEPAVVAPLEPGFVFLEDAVVTLLSLADAVMIADSVVDVSDALVTTVTLFDVGGQE